MVMFASPTDLYVEALTPSVMVLGDEIWGGS